MNFDELLGDLTAVIATMRVVHARTPMEIARMYWGRYMHGQSRVAAGKALGVSDQRVRHLERNYCQHARRMPGFTLSRTFDRICREVESPRRRKQGHLSLDRE